MGQGGYLVAPHIALGRQHQDGAVQAIPTVPVQLTPPSCLPRLCLLPRGCRCGPASGRDCALPPAATVGPAGPRPARGAGLATGGQP